MQPLHFAPLTDLGGRRSAARLAKAIALSAAVLAAAGLLGLPEWLDGHLGAHASHWLDSGAEAVLGASNFFMCGMLVVLAAQGRSPIPPALAWLGGLLIASSGAAHLATLWGPSDGLSGGLRLVAAFSALASVAAVPLLRPSARALLRELRTARPRRSPAASQAAADHGAWPVAEAWLTVCSQAPFGMGVCRLDGQWLVSSPGLRRLLACSEADLLAQRLHQWLAEDDRADLQRGLAAVVEGRCTEHRADYCLRRHDGTALWAEMALSLLPGAPGRAPPMVVRVEDTTPRRQAWAALDAQRSEAMQAGCRVAMAELLAHVAHEVNQPLAAIVVNAGACGRWLSAPVPDATEAGEALKRLTREARRAGEELARLRDFVRQAPPSLEPLDLNLLVQETVALAHDSAAVSGMKWTIDAAAGLPQVCGARALLQQLLMQLMSNAVDATRPAGLHGRLHVLTVAEAEGSVRLEVRDNGIGLEPAQCDRIFEPFYTTKPGHLGLGLVISRSIAEAHGGRLQALPRAQGGACLVLQLPAVKPMETRR